ncbi:ATP synthase F1 subunit delta [bacterium DOLZORAL124_64_63]|nr:MAG: ATP synthase F1 subunit delta [bacterium DOLZORAL124_64_63]
MRDRKVAGRYAGALMTSALAENNLGEVAESYAAVMTVVEEHPDLVVFLGSPQVAEEDKKKLLAKVFGDKVEKILLHFFYLLVDKNRIGNLRDIGEAFAEMVEEHQGVVHARVVTAVDLPDDLAAKLTEKLAAYTGAKVVLEKKIDPAVIGGVCVTMGNKILDGTVRTNLDLLRKKLEKAPVR